MTTPAKRILADLTDLLHDIFVRPDLVVTPQTSAADVSGWDSMKQIDINIAVEERYAIRLTSREIDAIRNVGDLIDLIERKTS